MRSNGRRRRTRTTCSAVSVGSSADASWEYLAGREAFIADAWWLPPDGDPIGPMALSVSCRLSGPACQLVVKQTGFEDTPRWRRYYDVVDNGWRSSLDALKAYLEQTA